MKNTKPDILIFIDWFVPAYKAGGPIQSLYNLVSNLHDFYNFYIVTSDADIDAPLELDPIQKNIWLHKKYYTVIYLDKAHQNIKTYRNIYVERNFDSVYLNSLFSFKFTVLPLIARLEKKTKIILAPRGMLGNGALSIKPLKKKIFLHVFKMLGWHKKVTWHASSSSEKNNIIENFGDKVNIKVASDLPKSIDHKFIEKQKKTNQLKVFFLSRIHPIKNLSTAIRILGQISKAYKVYFTIIGPVEDKAYWALCQEEIKKLPAHITVSSQGALPHHKVYEILKAQHLLLLPTQNENYGHVIVESWQSGCPTIISDQTPWVNLKKNKIGADLPLGKETDFIYEMENFARMNNKEFKEWSKSCQTYGCEFANNEKHIHNYLSMFNSNTIVSETESTPEKPKSKY